MEPTSPSSLNPPHSSTPTPPGPPEPPTAPEPTPTPEPPPVQETRTIYTPRPSVTPPVGGTGAAYVGASHRQRYVIGTIVLLAIGAGASGFFLLQRDVEPTDLKSAIPVEQASPTPTATPTPTPTPEPEPAVELDRENWGVVILNGSEKTGAAAKAKQELEELGYKVVRVGNADSHDYTKTQLMVTDPENPEAELLLEDLQTVFKTIVLSEEPLEESKKGNEKVNAQVTIGAE